MTTDERIAQLETAVRVLYRLLSAQFLGSDHFLGFPSRLTETKPLADGPTMTEAEAENAIRDERYRTKRTYQSYLGHPDGVKRTERHSDG